MVKAKLCIAVEDPFVAKQYGFAPDNVLTGEEPFFLNGPVAARVAIVDRDPKTGQLAKPVRWLSRSHKYATPDDISTPQGIAVSVFGTVLETLELFERKDILGHKVKWAFDSPQLLVVPNAGTWANAFYDRYSRSLQCFSFTAPKDIQIPEGTLIYTALSRDIVAHETGHAILDGIVPALYDSLTPQSLALHEAIADLTGIVMALQSQQIQNWLVREHGGKLSGDTPVSRLADEFGRGLGLERPLRDANNNTTMDDVTTEPHDLCQVLTGAFWKAMVHLHDNSIDKARRESGKLNKELIGKALGISARRISRILFRALDYLPPAEATFADYCRAVMRSDEVLYPEDKTGYREVLKNEFVKRGIVKSASELEAKPKKEKEVQINLNDILESEWAAYAFAEKKRDLLKIPQEVPFRLFPRRDVTRRYWLGPGQFQEQREVVFQVTWEEPEDNGGISGMPRQRAVFHGTTLVFSDKADTQGRYPLLSCLTSESSHARIRERSSTVRKLVRQGHLMISDKWGAIDSRPLAPMVFGRVTDNILRLRGTARLLHLTGGWKHG